jgi:AcrR family transcriptional regulator
MGGLALSEDKHTLTRSRGRPSIEASARIDREILVAARNLFLSHGYERTSMAMVTYAASVSKTTLYARYATKADLFRATVLMTVERRAHHSLSPVEQQTQGLEQGLRTYGYESMRIALAPFWSGYERLVYSEGARFPELTEVITERTALVIQTVATFLKGCAQHDRIVLRDPQGLATVYATSMRGFYSVAILRDRLPSEEEIKGFVDRLVDLLMAARAAW